MSAFISALLGGYGRVMLQTEERAHEEKRQVAENRRRALESFLSSPDLDPKVRLAGFQALMSPAQTADQGGGGGGGLAGGLIGRIKGKGAKGKQGDGDPIAKFVEMLGGLPTEGIATTSGEPGTYPLKGGFEEQTLQVPPMPSGKPAGAQGSPAEGTTGGKTPTRFSVPPVPSGDVQGVFKTPKQMAQEQIDLEKMRQEQVVRPEREQEHKERIEEEAAREEATGKREEAREKATQQRENARQKALEMREKNRQGFETSMERIKQTAQDNRERQRDIAMLRLSDSKAADALEKQANAERAKSVSEILKDLQQKITSATAMLKTREAEAQKQSWYQFWKDSPDVGSAQEERDNAQGASTFLSDHKANIIAGKEDLDDITAKTEDILRNGQPVWSRSDWLKANPGKEKQLGDAERQAMKEGAKVVP